MKNHLPKLTGLLLVSIANISGAALPPQYLQIDDFERCLATKPIQSYSIVCLPNKKPADCPQASWTALNALDGEQKLQACTTKKKRDSRR